MRSGRSGRRVSVAGSWDLAVLDIVQSQGENVQRPVLFNSSVAYNRMQFVGSKITFNNGTVMFKYFNDHPHFNFKFGMGIN